MVTQLLRRRWTVQDYQRLVAVGILTDRDRVELIQGEIIQMSPVGRRHAAHVKRINQLLQRLLGDRALIGVQDPIELDDYSQPQPDVVVLQPRDDFYDSAHPTPADVWLIIEVADTTVQSDREVKIPLYAADGIGEVWLVDINAQCIEVYRQPTPTGYESLQQCYRGDSLVMQAFPEVAIAVESILGPST